MDFYSFLAQKGTRIGHFGARDDPVIRMRKKNWENRAVEAVEASEVVEADEVNEAAKVFKISKITTEDFSLPGSRIQLI